MSYGRRRGLRPVSPYVIVLALAVALTASFFLPTRAEAAFSDHTVTTISPSGTTINLFDYWVNPDDHLSVSGNGGINANHRFQFNDGQGGESLNRWTGGENPQSGIVSNTLFDGYPRLSDTWGGKSLRYLFDSSAQTGKTSHFGVTGLLQAQGGYYVYDSTHNYAAYNANKNAFDIYDTGGVGNSSHQGQFFPFDAADKVFNEENDRLAQNGITADNTASYNGGKPVNHHFGLSMSTRFVQPDGGKTNKDEDMTFEFAGDDDVWVFIDDVLVGDIGGIHDRASLNINFKTGDIKVNGKSDGTLLSKYQKAGEGGDTRWYGSTFADGTNHTLKFFYLERGALYSNMELKFNLVTVPESDIIKFDQDGKFVQGAEFQLYKTDKDFKTEGALLGSGTTDEAGCLTLTNDDGSGVINFDDLYNKDHSNKYYLLKETSVPKGYRSNLTTTDGSMRLEYEPTSDKNGAGGVIINRGGMDAGSAVWRTGAFAGAKETITAPSIVYKANDDLRKSNDAVSLDSGILFAVVLKRDKSASIKDPSSWYAVSGDPSTGAGYTLAKEPGTAGAIEAAKKDLHAFTLNTSGQYQVEIQNLPGDISKYYYLLSGEARKDAEYTVAIYHTTARSIGDATPKNTVHVYSDDIAGGTNFKRQFATRLLVTNIQNRLFVQKTDTEGNPVDGATFGLYKATTDANGKVVPKDDQGPYDTLTTGSVDNPVRLEGAGIFPCTSDGNKPLKNGTYFLKEVSAPKGFLLNDTLTKVIVDDDGVHADAGTDDDGVSTFVGPGALMKSLGQFGAEGDIDNTLTWIKGTRQTSNGETNVKGNLTWTDVEPVGADDTVHLKYGANGRMYQYGPTEEGKPYRLETETGWIRMGITQDEQPKGITAKGARAGLGAMNLNALFTGATCVRVANEREASLEVTKKVVVPDGLTGNKDAGFTFKFTVPKGKTYKAAVFEKAGTVDEKQVGNVFDLTNGYSQTIKADETIRVYGLGEGDEYTVQELTGADEMPADGVTTAENDGGGIAAFPQITFTAADQNTTYVYQVTEQAGSDASTTGGMTYDTTVYYAMVQNTLDDKGQLSSTATYWKADGTQLTDTGGYIPFKNTYTVAQTMLAPVTVQKTLAGRAWEQDDKFDFTLTPADDATMKAVKNKVVTQKKAADSDETGDLTTKVEIAGPGDAMRTTPFGTGDLVFTRPGVYTFKVNETRPTDADKTGISYDDHTSTVTYTVTDIENGTHTGKLTASVAYDNKQATTDADRQVTGAAAFTNTYAASGTYAGIDVTKTLVGTPLENGRFPFTIEAMTYNGTKAPEPVDSDKSFTNTVGKDDGDDTQTATMSGKLKMNFTQLSYNKMYVYKVSEVHDANAAGYTYDTEYPGDAFVLIAVKPNPDNKGQLYTKTTIVKGPDVTALVGVGDNVDALTAEAIKGLNTTTNYVQTVSSRGAKPATPIVPFKNEYKVETVEYGAKAGLQIEKKFTGTGDASRTFSFTVTPEDYQAEGQDGTKFILTSADAAAKKLDITGGAETFKIPEMKLGDTKTVSLLPKGLQFTHDDVSNECRANVYQYRVEENVPKPVPAGYTYDKTVYTVKIAVSDNGDGTLKVETTVLNSDGKRVDYRKFAPGASLEDNTATIPFENSYKTVASDELTPQVTKKISGTESTDKKFSFTLTATSETKDKIAAGDLKADGLKGDTSSESKTTEGKITSKDGQPLSFSGMQFNKAGDYTFTLTEAHGEDDDPNTTGVQNAGWTMDDSTYTVTVKVEDKNAKLTVTGVAVEKDGDDKSETLEVKNGKVNLVTFTNSYAAKGSVTLAAKKRFTGGALAGNDFSFALYKGDKTEGTPIETGTNDKNGNITFQPINYTESGDYEYTIKEVTGNDQTIVYDGQKVKVKVSVTDNKNGTLDSTATYDGDEAVPTFTNAKPTADATIEAKKTLTGKDLTEGAFNFGLYQGDASTGNPVQLAQNDKDGKINFALTGLTIGEYDYILKEENVGADPTITYDTKAMKVHVSVKAEGGKAKATVTYDGKNDAPTFENTYQPAETSVALAAKKTYVKSDSTPAALKGGEFTFNLYKGDLTAEQLKGKQPIRTAENGEDGTVTFPAIDYTKAGEYKYTIVERKGDLSHVAYDDTVHHAVVTVVDNAGKLEASVAYDDGKTDAPTFKNTYNATGSAELTATKVVAVADGFKHDTKLKGGEYTFELKDADGKVLDTAKNDADGKVSFTREFQLSDLGGAASKDFTYTIVEQPGAEPGMVYDSHPLTYTVTVTDGGNGALNAKAIVTSASGSDTFTNTYQPAATGLALGAQKSYVKKDDNTPIVPKCGEFTFDVYEGNLTAEQLAGAKPVRTATNGADGSVNFDAFSYAKPGTHEYTIVERKGDLAYVTYDAAVHHAVVTVADNAGTLQASAAYDGTNVTKPSFTNTYEAQATDSGAIALTKSVDVHDGSYQLKAGDFAFELVGSDGSVIQTQKNDAHGKVAFDKLTFDHAGTFTYTVREVQPTGDAPGVPGVTYTGKTYTLTYVVKDNNDGKLVVESSTVKPSEGTENGVTPNTMTFANSYQPGQTSYQISGTKVLENADPATTRTPADGEFTFALIDVATGQEIDRTTNVGKAFTFKAISYTATGSHAYQVKEVAGQDGTITYSDAVLDVTVNVTDDGSGQLTATANKTAADLTFTNTYTPTATTATITGTKALTGRDLAEGEFFFDLKDADGNVVQTVQNGADGTFGFAPLQLDKVGTYVYTVSERAGATANGVTYDTTVFTATVTVTENAETHALEAQVAYSKGGKAADAVAFSNSYAPAATEVKLGASKVLSGEGLKEGQFSFQLKDADGKVLQTAKNAADGTVGFEAISYDKPGTYAYSISEVDDGQKNVTYDAAEHRVTVTVTDDGAGHLVATVTYDGAVAPVFKNTYTPPTTPPTEPPTNPPSKSPVPKEEKPGLPYTGDTSLSPMALGGIAGGAVVLIAAGVILRRRNR